MNKSKFPKRVVLATGYPCESDVHGITVTADRGGWAAIRLRLPKMLWLEDCPRYRLVLERVEGK